MDGKRTVEREPRGLAEPDSEHVKLTVRMSTRTNHKKLIWSPDLAPASLRGDPFACQLAIGSTSNSPSTPYSAFRFSLMVKSLVMIGFFPRSGRRCLSLLRMARRVSTNLDVFGLAVKKSSGLNQACFESSLKSYSCSQASFVLPTEV